MLLTYPTTFPGTAPPSGYWHLNSCISDIGEGRKQQCNTSLLISETKATYFNFFSSGTHLPKLNQWALSFFSQKYLEASKLLWKEKTKNKQTKPTKMQGRSPNPRGQTQETASSRGRERLVTKSSWAVPREILWLNPSYWPPSQGWAHCKAGHPLGNRNLCCAASLKPSWLLC